MQVFAPRMSVVSTKCCVRCSLPLQFFVPRVSLGFEWGSVLIWGIFPAYSKEFYRLTFGEYTRVCSMSLRTGFVALSVVSLWECMRTNCFFLFDANVCERGVLSWMYMNINKNKNISQQTSSSKNVVSRSVLRDPVAGRVHVTSFTQRDDYEFSIWSELECA